MRPENDPLLERLRGEDPAAAAEPSEAAMRAAVKRRAAAELGPKRSKRPASRTRILVATAAALAVGAVATALFAGSDGVSPGPDQALAIEHGPNGVTLTITDAGASAEEMNRELADAGIERVRVISVPGSPNHAGTWAGFIDLIAACDGGPTRSGFGIRIPHHVESELPAPGQDVVDINLPRSGEINFSLALQTGSGKRAIVSTKTIDDAKYTPAILIAIRPRTGADDEQAKQLDAQDLTEMGGVFAPYGEALADGRGSCSDLGLQPLPEPTFPPPGDWVTIPISNTPAGAERMTDQLRAEGIRGRFRLIPAQPEEVGYYLGWARKPAFGPDQDPIGNRIDVTTGNPARPEEPSAKVLALRREAFTAFPDARWVFYVGRPPEKGEPPLVVTIDGPENAAAALRNHCKGASRVVQPNGHRWCATLLPAQVPRP